MGSSPGVTKQPEECVKVAVGCEVVSMTFENVKSAQPPTTLCLPSVLLRESEPGSLLKKAENEMTSAVLTSAESHGIKIHSPLVC